ncbi:MAG TPA: outer membrane protein assembly factor BamA [Candidatus Dormibacteraeota bacterium]|nr:outer membrane protein assembly factor BamA [Candidatus Dormibacteraeota bacterium]
MRALFIALAVAGFALRPTVGSPQEAGTLPVEGVRIERVEIVGNQRVEDEAIRVKLKERGGGTYDPQSVDDDIRAIYKMGFFDDVRATMERQQGQWVLTYDVHERPFIRQVHIEGNKKIDTEELEGMLHVRPTTILDPEKARQGIEEAKSAYEKKGYLDADIRYETTPVGENEVDVSFLIDEREPIRIQHIEFEGNEQFSDSELKRIMQTGERGILSPITGSGNLDREVLKTDTERLTAWYYENGFIDVRIDEPKVERKDDGLTVTIKIDEGEQYHFGTIATAGETLPEIETAQQGKFEAHEGEIFKPSLLRKDINNLTEAYGDLSYAFVNVTPATNIDQADKRVDVTYTITRGPAVSIDRIEISGNTKTRDKVIRRELELDEQGAFSGTKLRRSQDRLRRLGFFEDVNITTRKADAEDKLDMIVDVREGNTGAFSAGAGISSGESFLFNVRLSESNLFGRGQALVLNADFGSIRRNISLSFTEPYFLDTPLTLGIDAFNWQLEFDQFTRGGTGGGIRTLYPFPALGLDVIHLGPLGEVSLLDTRLGLEYRIENADISNVARSAATVLRAAAGTSLTSSIIPRVFRDTRNNLLDPTAGSFQDFSIEIAGLGGDSDFFNAQSRARWYIPVWQIPKLGPLTFATGWNFGYGLGFGGDPELPLFERYFPGGINSLRGFQVRSLGPRVDVFEQGKGQDDQCPFGPNACGRLIRRDVVGGSQQLVFNNEIIFPIVQQLGVKGVFFCDAGNAFLASQGIDFADMRVSIGGGIRWLSPIGPLRIEVGFPLNAQSGDQIQRIQFSFGAPP